MQDQIRNFYDDFGSRISFIRKKRGLTLGELSGGSSSTAKSWESGIRPRPDQWEAIAARVGLSVSFVFLGKPTSAEDYEFIAKFADEIGPQETVFQSIQKVHVSMDPEVNEAAATYRAGRAQTAEETIAKIKAFVDELIASAQNDPNRLGWILEQLRSELRMPGHWKYMFANADEHPSVKAAIESARAKQKAFEAGHEGKKDTGSDAAGVAS